MSRVAKGAPITHKAEIVAFVPAGKSLWDAEFLSNADQGAARAVNRSTFDRYLVREDRGNSTRGKPYKPRYYAPRCSTVEVTL
jgi:hypothetical protein